MRIISQGKMTDMPYDGAVFYIFTGTENKICVYAHVPDEDFLIGTYNSKEDAVYVMSLIRTTFMCNHKYFYVPEAEEVSVIREKMDGSEQE